MFGIDFSELVVILVVALIVIGPERLPKVARTCGHLLGRAQRYIKSVKADISRDMAIEEIRQFRQDMQQEANSAEQAIMHATQIIDQQALQLDSFVPQPGKSITPPIPKQHSTA
ncbi:MAG TPA: Sec-independent protein translocase protein TatB [Gallionella sp.]|nr:Sec-independent protein translocase protein TatB [Gallionella sp.]